ncbi:glycosyltransferase [Spirosoma sp. HMF3257]|uniref:Glycosyltransferase n=1 Tax=Spirosoma telluris TaxID=2183553 RepID=A0A327NLC1_9BACT|nr:glycosyltransferase [Spirosoma telluris]RAI74724.1 hypothetical protein HMF3257_11455 [Spirosoma telluris]
MKKIKVVVVTSSISRAAGGLFDAIKDLNILLLESVDLRIYSYKDKWTDSDIEKWNGINVFLYNSSNFFQYSTNLRDDIINDNADILHVHGLWRYPHALINYWKKKTGKPVIVTPHGMLDSYIIKNQSSLKRLLGDILFARKSFQSIDYYQALSLSELDAIRNYGISKPIALIPNGINLNSSIKPIKTKDEKKRLLFLGRLHPKKGVDLLINAIGEIALQYPELLGNWVVDIVGWSQEGFDLELKSIVKQYSLENIVIFHGGLFDSDKIAMYQKADGYILPSHGEGLPMTILEAWTYNLPVIMTSFCNLPEGFEVEAALEIENNQQSVKEGLIQFLNMSDDERIKMGQRGYDLVKESFTWASAARKMLDFYYYILDNNKKIDFLY